MSLAEGASVTFWWFDTRNLDYYDNDVGERTYDDDIESDDPDLGEVENSSPDGICDRKDAGAGSDECAYEKMASKTVTLVYDNAIQQLAMGTTTLLLTAATFAF